MKRVATLVLVMLAMSASAAVDARALAHEGPKTQWAPTRNFSSLNARAVFAVRTPAATSPYAGEERETAAGEKDWQYAAGNPTRFVDADGRGVADLQCIASGADGCNIFGAGRYAEFAFAVRDAERRYARTQSVEDYKAWATISGRFEQRLLDLDERGATGPLYSGVAGVGVLVGGPALVAVGEALPAPGVLLSGAANVARGAANWAYQSTVGPLVSGVRAFAGSAGSQGVMNAFRYIAGPFLAKFGLNIYDLFDESMVFTGPASLMRHELEQLTGSTLKRVGENTLGRKVGDLFPAPVVTPPRGAHLAKDAAAEAARLTAGSRPLDNVQKDAIREEARNIWQDRTGRRAIWDDMQVHHRIPLEWAHHFPGEDPNVITNLMGVAGEDHTLITNAWNEWRNRLGRTPTQSEVLSKAAEIDRRFRRLMTPLK